MSTATERALNVDGGVWLAMNEATSDVLWPRCLYPSADDAIEAHWEWSDDGWCDERVRLTWAVPASDEPGYWCWSDEFRDSWEAIECWMVGP